MRTSITNVKVKILILLLAVLFLSTSFCPAFATESNNGHEETIVMTVDDGEQEGVEVNQVEGRGMNAMDSDPPTAPGDLIISSITDSVIAIEWSASLDNNGVEEYMIYNGSDVIGTTTSLSYILENVADGDVYMLSVRAKDYAENISESSNILCVYHTGGDTVVTPIITVPSDLQIGRLWGDKLLLVWQGMDGAGGYVEYEVYCNDELIDTTYDSSYIVQALEDEKTYVFKVRAKNGINQTSEFSNTVCVYHVSGNGAVSETLMPPTNLAVDIVTQNSVKIKWDSPSYSSNVEGYEIYDEDRKIGETSANTYTITGLVDGDTYMFSVKSVDSDGNLSQSSNVVCLYHVSEDGSSTSGLSAPVILPVQSINLTDKSINLNWYKSQGGTGAVSYSVYINGNLYASNLSGTSCNVQNLFPKTTYVFKVVAKDAENNVAVSLTISVTTRESTGIQISCATGKTYNILMIGKNISDLGNKEFVLYYDPQKLEVVDLCSMTKANDSLVNVKIAGTDVIITEFNSQTGVIKFRLDKSFAGQQWTGLLNAVKFKSLVSSGATSIIQEIEQ